MKILKKALAIILTLVIMSTSFVSAYAEESKATEAVSFSNISQEELLNKQLSEKGDNKITFFEDGVTDFVIVTPDKCTEPLNEAVVTLQSVLEEMTGTKLPIVNENQADDTKKHLCIDTVMNTQRPTDNIDDGYQIVIDDKKISVCGTGENGTRNGIYAFIEDILGCMFLTPDDTYIPQQKNIYLEKMNKIIKPAVKWSDV